MTQDKKPGDENREEFDLIIEAKKERVANRPKKLESLVDTQAMRFLGAMDFQSFDNLSGAFEKFMMDAPLFQGDVSFANAARALDLTAQLFGTIDRDGNHLLSREEFAYLILKTNDMNRRALGWLIENFNAFTQACFFKDQISKDDIEAGRNVFHGLKIAQEKLGFNKQPTLENLQELDGDAILAYLTKNKGSLTAHEASGLQYLHEHIKKHVKRRASKESAEKVDEDTEGFQGLAGKLDKRTLRTLQALKLNSFESFLAALLELMEGDESINGEGVFDRTGKAIESASNVLTELEMGDEHAFTRSELLIISKLTQRKEKKPLAWLVKHFDAFTKALFLPGKARKKDLDSARKLFHGLDFMERFEIPEGELSPSSQLELKRKIKAYLEGAQSGAPAGVPARRAVADKDRAGLEALVRFMESHAK